jgi:hypothetical protein
MYLIDWKIKGIWNLPPTVASASPLSRGNQQEGERESDRKGGQEMQPKINAFFKHQAPEPDSNRFFPSWNWSLLVDSNLALQLMQDFPRTRNFDLWSHPNFLSSVGGLIFQKPWGALHRIGASRFNTANPTDVCLWSWAVARRRRRGPRAAARTPRSWATRGTTVVPPGSGAVRLPPPHVRSLRDDVRPREWRGREGS